MLFVWSNLYSCSKNKFRSKNHTKNKNKNKNKSKNKSREDFLHYMEKKNNENNNNNNENKKHKDFNFKSLINYDVKTWKYPVTANQILNTWMAISSEEFKNIVRFPPIKKPDGTTEEIEENALNFRINHTAECTDPNKPKDERFFWFRLSCKRIWYSSTQSDLNILGALQISEILDMNENSDISGENEIYCLKFKDEVHKEWKLCNEVEEVITLWYCTIRKCLGFTEGAGSERCYLPGVHSNPNVVVKEKIIKKPIIMVPLPSPTCNDGWNYDQNGDDWECDCKEGKEQSPIDLPELNETISSPVKPMFQYKEVAYMNEESTLEGILEKSEKLQIWNEDQLLQIWHKDFGKAVTVDGTVYNAQRITFHTPSNHHISGKSFPLEVSIIHFGVTQGDIGKQLVLNFLFETVPGVYNSFFEDLDLFSLPDKVQKSRGLQKPIFIPRILWEESEKSNEIPIMKPFSFYTYEGSLMFPPCTERTINLVASKPIPVSNISIELIKEAYKMPDLKTKTGDIIKSDQPVFSNRLIQTTNNRPIFHYNHEEFCGPDPSPRKPKPTGHYEKVINKGTQYFFVNGVEPSGMPGAFVVSEGEAKGLGFTG